MQCISIFIHIHEAGINLRLIYIYVLRLKPEQLPEQKSQSRKEAYGYAIAGGQLARRLSNPDPPQLTGQISEIW